MTLAQEQTVEQLVEEHQGLVRYIASKYFVRGLEMDDLISEANIALLIAVDKFDPSKGEKFSSFAGSVIRNKLWKLLERHQAVKRQSDYHATSITTPVGGEDEDFTLLDVLMGPSPNPVQWTLAHELREVLIDIIHDPSVLTESERTVIIMTIQGLSLSEITERLGRNYRVISATRTRARDKISLRLNQLGYTEAFEKKTRVRERNETTAQWVAIARKNGVSENKFHGRLAIGWEPERAVLPEGSKLRKRFTDDERQLVREKLLEGLHSGQIYDFFEGRSRQSVTNLVSAIRKQLKSEGLL